MPETSTAAIMAAAMTVCFLISSPFSGGYRHRQAVMFHRHDRSVTTALIRLGPQGRLGFTEAISHAANGLDADQGKPRGSELGPEPSHVHIDGSGFHEPVLAPHETEELLAAEDPARRAGQGGRELELRGGEIDPLAFDRHLESVPVNLEVAHLQVKLAVHGLRVCAAAHNRPYTRDQLAR